MTIYFGDNELEQWIQYVRVKRGDSSVTKTAKDLLRETLVRMGVPEELNPSKGESVSVVPEKPEKLA